MARRLFLFSVAAFILFSFSTGLTADIFVMETGGIIEGEIIDENDDTYVLDTERGRMNLSKDKVKSRSPSSLDPAHGRLVEVTGTVEVLRKGKTEWTAAEKDMPLNEGDMVRSGSDSKAVVLLANTNIVAVEQNTELDLKTLQKSRKAGTLIRASMSKGQLWSNVGGLKKRPSRFYVQTPTAVTGVRGTVFTVEILPEDSTTKVAVVEGSVQVQARGMIEPPTRVRANKMTSVGKDVAPTKPEAISEDYVAQWNQYKGKFRMMRIGMIGGRFGLTQQQTILAGAGMVFLVVVIIVVLIRRRLTA